MKNMILKYNSSRLVMIIFGLFLFLFLGHCTKKSIDDDDDNGFDPTKGYRTDRAVGESAKDLLSGETFTKLNVEIVYVEGYDLRAATISNLENFLIELIHKPDGIEIITRSIAPPGDNSYSATRIRELEKKHRQIQPEGKELSIFFFIADGNYAFDQGNSQVLGIAYNNTSMALFAKTVHQHSGGVSQPSRTKLESTVINHEAGHILGLVNITAPMQTDHQDHAHGHHCDNSDCLMYYTANTTDILDNLLFGSIPELDQNCRADLKALGGK